MDCISRLERVPFPKRAGVFKILSYPSFCFVFFFIIVVDHGLWFIILYVHVAAERVQRDIIIIIITIFLITRGTKTVVQSVRPSPRHAQHVPTRTRIYCLNSHVL